MITKDNYESFMIDYWDGTLPDTVRKELERFLVCHPDLQKLSEGIEVIKLLSDDLVFEKKNMLKRVNVDERMDYYAIAASEDVLTEREKKIVEERVDGLSFQKSVAFYLKLKMVPDYSVGFPRKDHLYRRSAWLHRMVQYGGVAALLLFLFGIIFLRSEDEKVGSKANSPVVAKLKEETKEIKSLTQSLPLKIRGKTSTKIKSDFVTGMQNDSLQESGPVLPRRCMEVMAVLPLEKSTSGNREIIIGPKMCLILPDKNDYERIAVKQHDVLYALMPDMKLSDNVISNLIRVVKDLKERSKDKASEYVFR